MPLGSTFLRYFFSDKLLMAVILPWKKKQILETVGALEAAADTDPHVWGPQAVKMQPASTRKFKLKEFLTLVCTIMQGHQFSNKSWI